MDFHIASVVETCEIGELSRVWEWSSEYDSSIISKNWSLSDWVLYLLDKLQDKGNDPFGFEDREGIKGKSDKDRLAFRKLDLDSNINGNKTDSI